MDPTAQNTDIFDYLTSGKLGISIALIIVSIAIWKQASHYSNKALTGADTSASKKTSVRLTTGIFKSFLVLLTIAVVLQVNDIDVPGIITGLGVAGVVVGFALQDLLKDIIMGLAIMWESSFSLGDVIDVNGEQGEVIAFNLKSTRIRSITSSNIITYCNRDVATVEVVSDQMDIDAPMGYDVEPRRAREVCEQITQRCRGILYVTSAEFKGTQEFGDDAIIYRVRLHCRPAKRHDVYRAAHAVVQDVYEEQGLEIPFRHLDVNILDNR